MTHYGFFKLNPNSVLKDQCLVNDDDLGPCHQETILTPTTCEEACDMLKDKKVAIDVTMNNLTAEKADLDVKIQAAETFFNS